MTSLISELPAFCRRGYDYANQILLEEIPACSLVQAAVRRFFQDVKKSAKGGPFVLDYERAERVMRFVHYMPHIKGPLANSNLDPSPWQCFVYLNLFGWVNRETGARRFRKAYTEIPRGNGKSTMVAPVALYMLAADKEGGAEIYSAAVTRDQARIVFNAAKTMAMRRRNFLSKAGVSVLTYALAQDETAGTFQALSSDARSLDGLNVHLAILDELAQHKVRDVHDVIETGMGKRTQPLMWMITTAGPNQGGIGFEVHDYAKKLLEGVVDDESFFAMIYTIDDGDDWMLPETWQKANPNWGVSVVPDTIAGLANRAIQVPSFQNAFKMKHLNMWTNANENFVDSTSWSKQAMPIEENDFVGDECMIALDLASKVDIAASVKIFRRPNDADVSSRHPYKYFIVPTLYLPEHAIKTKRNVNYEGWAIAGHLVVTPGEVIDFSYIEEDLMEDCKKYNVQDIPFDPWQATQLAQRMTEQGLPMIEFPATVRNFSEPMKEFEVLVRQGLLFHNNNPCFNWMISNLVAKEDRKGNIFPRKDREENKIDGPVAAIMAIARWVLRVQEPEFKSVYSDPNYEVVI